MWRVYAAISSWACGTWPQSIWTLRNFSPLRARWFFPKRLTDDLYLEFRPLSRRFGIQHGVPYNTHLILGIVLGGQVLQLSPLCRWGDWGTHSSNNPGYTASQWWSKIWPWSVGHESELESQLQNQVSLEFIWCRLSIKVLVIKKFKRFKKTTVDENLLLHIFLGQNKVCENMPLVENILSNIFLRDSSHKNRTDHIMLLIDISKGGSTHLFW